VRARQPRLLPPGRPPPLLFSAILVAVLLWV
jgi:hypothetical protein